MKIPLHIDPRDQSDEANLARIAHHNAMFALNPRGFRNPGNASKPTRIERLGSASFA